MAVVRIKYLPQTRSEPLSEEVLERREINRRIHDRRTVAIRAARKRMANQRRQDFKNQQRELNDLGTVVSRQIVVVH